MSPTVLRYLLPPHPVDIQVHAMISPFVQVKSAEACCLRSSIFTQSSRRYCKLITVRLIEASLHNNSDLNSISAIAIPRFQFAYQLIKPPKSIEMDKSIGKSS
jgi:hypothetical protein